MTLTNIQQILDNWDIELKKIRDDIFICGSPERAKARFVIEDKNNKLYILENIHSNLFKRKNIIAKTTEYLAQKKLTGVCSYLRNNKNKFLSLVPQNFPDNTACCGKPRMKSRDEFWQLLPFIEDIPLKRPQYVFDSWRGKVTADFLIELKEKSKNIPFLNKQDIFSLTNYVLKITTAIKKNNSSIYKEIKPITNYLKEEFFDNYKKLPINFCHGDYHPLNIIWGENKINAVIDWEFVGYKKEGYDAANMIGCVGSEDLNGLIEGLVPTLIKILQEKNFLKKESWKTLIDFIIALRFAWLSEWLRRDDKQMITQEINYMNLLIKNKKKLNKAWKI